MTPDKRVVQSGPDESYETVFVWSARRLWVCQTCGAYVGDYPKHGRWHYNMERTRNV